MMFKKDNLRLGWCWVFLAPDGLIIYLFCQILRPIQCCLEYFHYG